MMPKSIKSNLIYVLFILGSLFGSQSHAQLIDATTNYRIITSDGNTYVGLIIEKTPETVRLNTERLGEITIRFVDIELIEKATGGNSRMTGARNVGRVLSGDFDNASVNHRAPNSYLMKHSGFGLESGEVYYKNVWLFFNEVNFGITDYFSLGVGVMPITVDNELPAWMQANFTLPIKKDKIAVGLGTFNGGVLNGESNFGIVYSDFTIGNPSNHVNIGFGKSYVNGTWNQKLALTLSGSVKVTKSGSVAMENYMLEDYFFYSAIFKQYFRTGCFDYGLFYVDDGFDRIALPWLGVSFFVNK